MENFTWRTFHVLVSAASVLIVGCASTASVRSIQPLEGNLNQYKSVLVIIEAAPHVQQRQGGLQVFQPIESRLRSGMVNGLKASRTFQNVSDKIASTDADLRIVVTVDQFVYGTKLEGLTNVLPGAGPKLGVQVELLNARTGRKLAHLQSEATTSDTYAQADAIAEKVVAEIVAKAK